MPFFEKRYDPDESKFQTQKTLTFYVVTIFSLVTAWVLFYGTVEQRSAIVQCWIGLAIGAVAYWIATTKGAQDTQGTLTKMLPPTVQANGQLSDNTAALAANTAATAAATSQGEPNATKP